MRNYRQVSKQNNMISWGGGKSQAVSVDDAIIYDIKQIVSSYTVPKTGVLFYFGNQRIQSIFPVGFETLVAINISQGLTYQLNTVKKINVVEGQVLNFTTLTGGILGGMLILAESGAGLLSYLTDKTYVNYIDINSGTITINNPNNIQGFGWLGYIANRHNTYILENEVTKIKRTLLVSQLNNNQSAVGFLNYNKELLFEVKNSPINEIGATSCIVGKLKKGAKEIKHVEKIGTSIENTRMISYQIQGSSEFPYLNMGYWVWVGAYEVYVNINILSGFTVLHTKTYNDGITSQTVFIAYMKVLPNNYWNFSSWGSSRFGGSLFSTFVDISKMQFDIGEPIKDTINKTFTFPAAKEGRTLFGIIAFNNDSGNVSGVSNNNSLYYNQQLISQKPPTYKPITCLVSLDHNRRISDNLIFPYTDGALADDKIGIWVEFY